MTMTDPIADYLTRLRNAIQAKHKRVDIPASNLKRELTKLLLDNKYIAGYTESKSAAQGVLRIQLKYRDAQPVITGLKRISTPLSPRLEITEFSDRVLRAGGPALLIEQPTEGGRRVAMPVPEVPEGSNSDHLQCQVS